MQKSLKHEWRILILSCSTEWLYLVCSLSLSCPAEATVELSLDSPRNERKKEAAAKPSVSTPSLSVAASMAKKQPAALEEVQSRYLKSESKSYWDQNGNVDHNIFCTSQSFSPA